MMGDGNCVCTVVEVGWEYMMERRNRYGQIVQLDEKTMDKPEG
jgi:hypothetical protein